MKHFWSQAVFSGKLILKDKSSLFWVFIYPLILVTLMTVAFRGFSTEMPAVRAAAEADHPFLSQLQDLEILDLEVLDLAEAKEALSGKELEGVFLADGSLLVRDSSLPAKILSEIATELLRAGKAYSLGYQPDYSLSHVLTGDQGADMLLSILSMTVAMFSLFSYFSGVLLVENIQANLSPQAMRLALAPLQRPVFLAAGTLVNTLLSFAESMVLLVYLQTVWGVRLLDDAPRTLLLMFLASALGMAIGLFAGASNSWSSNAKIPVGIALMLVLSALAGMMGPDLRIFIDSRLPWVNRFNPISLIGQLLYRLNALGSTRGYGQGLLILFGGTLILLCLSLVFLKNRQYRSL